MTSNAQGRLKYPKYKPSHIDWIGNIPEKWGIKKLKYLAECLDNRRKPLNAEERGLIEGEGNIPYYGANGIVDRIGEYIFDEDMVLVGEDGAPFLDKYKDVAFDIQGKSWVNNHAHILKGLSVNHKFLTYALNTVDYALRIDGSTREKLTQGDMMNIQIPYLPMSEQQSIVEYIDDKTTKIDQAITLKKNQIELLKEKRMAMINQAVTKGLDANVEMIESGIEWIGEIPKGWEVRKLKTLALIKRGASPRPIDDMRYFDDNGEYAWVRIEDVTASKRYLETSKEKLSELGKNCSVPLEPGEMFLSIAGSVGKQIITNIKCCIHDGFVAIKNMKIDKEFLYWIFEGGELYKGEGKLGTQLNLNSTSVGSLSIPFPPTYKEQQVIVSYLDHENDLIDQTIAIVQHSIDLLAEYRQSLISHVVTGKIKVVL